jgi:aspartyl-tRNA(Asn)/glutamyl-tRNA(Gln) amidotransferase subunit A
MTDQGLTWPAHDLRSAADALARGELTSAEIVDAHLDRIARLDPTLHAVLADLSKSARDVARRRDDERSRSHPGQLSPIHGLPLAIKDNFETTDQATTAGSPSLRDYVAGHDATTVERLNRAGAVFVSKVNLDEFAYGGESANPLAETKNPWDAESVPGGSSGGSGAAVAAGMCMAALGSDTGGSIRNPSAWCGVVGFKPTFGAIDPRGVVPLAWSLDTVGVLARTVDDCALLFAETADAMQTLDAERRRLAADEVRTPLRRRLRLAVAGNVAALAEPAVRSAFETSVDELLSIADVELVDLPRPDDAVLATITILTAEGAAAWETGIRAAFDRYGPPVRAALDVGRLIRATEYIHAQRVREGLRREVAEVYADYDAVLMPSMGIDPRPDVFDDLAVSANSPMWELCAKFTCMWNLTGAPVVSAPYAFTPADRPLAMQIVGKPGRDWEVLRIARALEDHWDIPRSQLVPTWVASTLASAAGG